MSHEVTDSACNLPPGCMGAARETNPIVFVCLNKDCAEFEEQWEVRAFVEMGGTFLYDDDNAYCVVCGQEGKQVYL